MTDPLFNNIFDFRGYVVHSSDIFLSIVGHVYLRRFELADRPKQQLILVEEA